MRRISAALAAVAVATLGTLLAAAPASATPEPHYAVVPAVAWDWPGAYSPDMQPVPAQLSTVSCVGAHNPQLAKPDTGGENVIYPPTSDGDTGTSIETTNLGLDAGAGGTIKVGATLSDGASADAGAIRMFAYDHADANTAAEAPDFGPAIAAGSQVLELHVTGTVGTFGLTYDASNDSEGIVTFSGLRFVPDGAEDNEENAVPIMLCAKPAPATTEPPATTTNPATTEPATTEPSATDPTSTTSTTKSTLPVTGAALTTSVLAGLVLVAAGVGALFLARRHRAREQ